MDNERIHRSMARLADVVGELVLPGLCDRIRANIYTRMARAQRRRACTRPEGMWLEADTGPDECSGEARPNAGAAHQHGVRSDVGTQPAGFRQDSLGRCGVRQIGNRVVFTARCPRAREVLLAGSFNDWNPTATPMRRRGTGGVWQVHIRLPAGVYQYRLVVDGQWQEDPHNGWKTDNHLGGYNSLVEIRHRAARKTGVDSPQIAGAATI